MKIKQVPFFRVYCYLAGLMILALGIAFSVRSNLGSSPVASVSYMLSLVFNVDLGLTTTVWQCFLVIVQVLILRREFKPWMLVQLITCFVFGYFNTLAGMIVSLLPQPETMAMRLIFTCIGFTLCGFGVWQYSSSALLNMPSEGVVVAVSDKMNVAFHKVKIGFDVSSVVISIVCSLIFLHSLGSVGLGTVIISIMQGTMVGVFSRLWSTRLKALIFPTAQSKGAQRT